VKMFYWLVTQFWSTPNSLWLDRLILALIGRTPWSARVPLDPFFANGSSFMRRAGKPAKGRAADQGVRPTLEKRAASPITGGRGRTPGIKQPAAWRARREPGTSLGIAVVPEPALVPAGRAPYFRNESGQS